MVILRSQSCCGTMHVHKMVNVTAHLRNTRQLCCCVDKCVPVTIAWCVLRLRMEERAANTLGKQYRTADEGWSFSFGVGRRANNT